MSDLQRLKDDLMQDPTLRREYEGLETDRERLRQEIKEAAAGDPEPAKES